MINFKDKTVIVTGGSRGIGAATVELFAELGANVAFVYHSNHGAAKEVLTKVQKFSATSYCQSVDITNYDEVKKFVNEMILKYSQIDILVNNAGIWEYGSIEKMSVDDWKRTIDINLHSVFYFTKTIVNHMKNKKISGKIVNIASTAGQRGEAYHSHYAASKGAIISFTKSLASELGPSGITVNCVAPGWVATDMSKEAIENDNNKIIEVIPLGKIPCAENIAKPIVFLASDWAEAITGEILNVNSGSVLCG